MDQEISPPNTRSRHERIESMGYDPLHLTPAEQAEMLELSWRLDSHQDEKITSAPQTSR